MYMWLIGTLILAIGAYLLGHYWDSVEIKAQFLIPFGVVLAGVGLLTVVTPLLNSLS